MRYQKFPPAKDLAPFVKCYFVWEGSAPERLEVQSPPNGFSSVVFNHADPHWAYQNTSGMQSVPKAFASGQFTSNYHLVMEGAIGMVGIVFKASAFHNFFGMQMSHLVNSRMPLSLLLGGMADQLWHAIKFETTDEGRIAILEAFILTRLEEGKSRLSVIDEALEFIDEKKGCISVEEVAANFGISRRYLEKKFLEKVGLSPKFYARIKRFNALVVKYRIAYNNKNEKIDWQQIVFEYGFHDQSHLVKEFLEFNQASPTEYHRLHHEMTRFVKPR